MKPLELTVYPPAECECFHVENPWTYYGIVEPGGAMEPNYDCPEHFPRESAKQLTDAELAAEYWSWIAHYNKMQWSELASGEDFKESTWEFLAERNATLHRFATSPHYFEEAA